MDHLQEADALAIRQSKKKKAPLNLWTKGVREFYEFEQEAVQAEVQQRVQRLTRERERPQE